MQESGDRRLGGKSQTLRRFGLLVAKTPGRAGVATVYIDRGGMDWKQPSIWWGKLGRLRLPAAAGRIEFDTEISLTGRVPRDGHADRSDFRQRAQHRLGGMEQRHRSLSDSDRRAEPPSGVQFGRQSGRLHRFRNEGSLGVEH